MFFKKKKNIVENEKYQQFFYLVNKYDTIAVFFHSVPDFDALGSSFGLYYYLKENYPQKKIFILGENHLSLTPRLFPKVDEVNDITLVDNPFLAIVCDASVSKRISDERYRMAKEIVKLDHHLEMEDGKYGNLSIVNTNISSAAELISDLLLSNPKNKMSALAAKFLYVGIVGDSGRFLYEGTSQATFNIASKLISTGFNIRSEVYEKMYQKSIDSLRIQAYILNNFELTKHGVAYYVLDEEALEQLNLHPTAGKEHINIFSSIEGIGIWVSFAADHEIDRESGKTKPIYRVSIRSSRYDVFTVAEKYNGGGHRFACGARVYSEKELSRLVEDLDALIANEIGSA